MRLSRARHRLGGIVRDTGWTGANEVITLLTGIVMLQVLIVGLGPASYGRYAAIAALAAILTTLSSVWVVFLLLQHTLQDGRAVPEAFRVSLGLVLPASAVAFVAGVVLGPVMIPSLTVGVIAAFIAADLLAGVLFMVTGAAAQAAQGLPAATRIRLVAVLTRFFVVVGVGLSGRPSLPLLAGALLLGNLLVGGVVFAVVARRLSLRCVPRMPRAADVRQGFPYAGVLVSGAIQQDSDKIFLARLADPVDAGLYASAYKIVQLGFVPVRALLASSHPRFLVDTPGVENEHLRRAVRFSAPTVAYGLVATLGIIVLAPLVPVVLGNEYTGTQPLLVALAPLVVLRTMNMFPLTALLGMGRFTLRFYVMLGITVFSLLVYAVLIAAFSVTGAVVGALLVEAVLIAAGWAALVVAQRRHDRKALVAP